MKSCLKLWLAWVAVYLLAWGLFVLLRGGFDIAFGVL